MEELQADLMDEDLLEHILSLLQDSQLDVGVRYFAGGILAQLASRADAWTLDGELRSTVLRQLVCDLVVYYLITDIKVHQVLLSKCLFFAARIDNDMDPP